VVEPTRKPGRLRNGVNSRLPGWTDSNAHDPGIMLLELFAYLADWLAQHADAIAGEAYLAARRRGSKLQAQSRLQVEVDGEGWQRVSSLEASGPDDPHYLVERRHDGATVVRFGDGERGRRPPTDGDVRVAYRRRSRFVSLQMQPGRVVIHSDWRGK